MSWGCCGFVGPYSCFSCFGVSSDSDLAMVIGGEIWYFFLCSVGSDIETDVDQNLCKISFLSHLSGSKHVQCSDFLVDMFKVCVFCISISDRILSFLFQFC